MEKYDKIRVVGRGAYGTVYLCKRLSDKKQVIIKQIPVEQMTKDQRLAALNEVIVLSMLDHPNIIQYYENFLEDKALMIVMEYAEGGTLYDYLQQRNGQLLTEDEILKYFVQMVMSLQHVHSKQILHRDLKTHNILLDKKQEVLKISDFGISKVLSKSKAVTVVGTPCYISPELCVSKPYNQKSDIWALGCVLFELATLNRAFDAQTLPALVLKIMQGKIAPIPNHYSEDLKVLLTSMLQIDPDKRPSVHQILATPLVLPYLFTQYCDFGMLPVCSTNLLMTKHNQSRTKSTCAASSLKKPNVMSQVFIWGCHSDLPVKLNLPGSDVQLVEVSVGKDSKAAVTKNGRLILWELDISNFTRNWTYEYIPRYLDGQSAVFISRVACGDMFTVCVTDKGILMTFGCGTTGCLGHGNNADLASAKIVESLLGYSVTSVACGNSHVVVATSDDEVFAWGRGDYGRLGLGDDQFRYLPEKVVDLPAGVQIRSVHAAIDSSMLVTKDNKVLATGYNRFNKLGLNKSFTSSKNEEVTIAYTFMPVTSDVLGQLEVKTVSMGTHHSALITTSGECWCFGSNQWGQVGVAPETKDKCIRVDLPSQNSASKNSSSDVTDEREVEKSQCTEISEASNETPDRDINLEMLVFSKISCGDAFTIAETSDGSIWSWGRSGGGRLGRLQSLRNSFSSKNKQSHCDWIPGKVEIPDMEDQEIISMATSHQKRAAQKFPHLSCCFIESRKILFIQPAAISLLQT